MNKPTIGISVGDINGIGLEVILKTLDDHKILNLFTPVIYGSSKVVSYHKNIVHAENFQFQGVRDAGSLIRDPKIVNVVNCWQENVNITLGKATAEGGSYAAQSLEWAVADLKHGLIDALVTAPINKKAMELAKFPFPGHTEYLTHEMGVKNSLMLLVHDGLRVGLATGHISLKEVAAKLTKERIMSKIQILNETLKIDFGIERPTIAVLGLNPHAGDEGVLGDEEERIIRPAIVELKKRGIIAMGPFAADGFFGAGQYKKFDGVLAMYHDQGLAPFKALSFSEGVNYTAGLPLVRTSPDHGTGFDLVGKNEANPSSFRQAIFLAIDIVRNRHDYAEAHANPIQTRHRYEGEDEVIE